MDVDWSRVFVASAGALIVSSLLSAILYLAEWVVGGGFGVEGKGIEDAYILRDSRQNRAALLAFGFLGPILGGYFIQNGMADRGNEGLALASIVAGVLLAMTMPLATFAMLRHRIVITKDELVQHGMSRFRPLKIGWGEITSIAYIEGGSRYAVMTADGRKMYVESEMDGFFLFIQTCCQRLSPSVYEQAFNKGGVRLRKGDPTWRPLPNPDAEG